VPHAQINGLSLYYQRAGSGPPLLFISGTGGDLRTQPNVFAAPLSRSFDLLAYDQRGLGRTDKPDEPYSMAQYADDAAALLTHVGWDEALVLGVSFGGMVAQELALRHPARVKRLVLACTSPGGEGGASFPFHEIEHLKGEARARYLIPISDRRRARPRGGRAPAVGGARGARHMGSAARDRLPGADRGGPLRRHRVAGDAGEDGRADPGRGVEVVRRRPPLHAAGPHGLSGDHGVPGGVGPLARTASPRGDSR
jgi:pimeloyl-ACP methyl ester carboxylesterase